MGIFIALIIIFSWVAHLIYSLVYFEVDYQSPFFYLHILRHFSATPEAAYLSNEYSQGTDKPQIASSGHVILLFLRLSQGTP